MFFKGNEGPVNCGNHYANSCTCCGNEASSCNGECQWYNGECISKENSLEGTKNKFLKSNTRI